MNSGWIKLHRSVLNNRIFLHDRTAWHIFEVLMVLCDRRTGEWSGGRKQLAALTNVNENTLKKALSRLVNEQMVTQVSNTNYSVYRICKWDTYQAEDTQTLPKRYPNVTQTLPKRDHSNKNRELRIKNNSNVETQEVYDFYLSSFNKNANQYKLTDKRKLKLNQRLKDCGKEKVTEAIRRVSMSPFHMGDNDRGWTADLDFIIRSYEQVERLSTLEIKLSEEEQFKREQEEFIRRKNARN